MSFDVDYEDDILAHCLKNRDFLKRAIRICEAHVFSTKERSWLFELARKNWTGNRECPTVRLILERAEVEFPDKLKRKPVLSLAKSILTRKPSAPRTALDSLHVFVKQVRIQLTLENSAKALEKGDVEKAESALKDGTNKIPGERNYTHIRWIEEFPERQAARKREKLHPEEYPCVPTGLKQLDNILSGGARAPEVGLIMGTTGRGKCHPRGTKVIMYDGSLRKVENVRPGDLLMGPDSEPREVLNIGGGRGRIYNITPTKGEPWGCNLDHVLTLRRLPNNGSWLGEAGEVIDIPLRDYLEQCKKFKAYEHRHHLFSVPVEFPKRMDKLTIDPYFLGVWLGDGTKRRGVVCVTKLDPEIEQACEAVAGQFGLKVRKELNSCGCPNFHITAGESGKGKPNPLRLELDNCVRSDWRIKRKHLCASREDRLQLLAGLLDTDGYVHYGNFEITQKKRGIADSIAFLARSLGFKVVRSLEYKTSKTGGPKHGPYYTCSIIGDCSVIPTRIERKRAPVRQQKKNPLRTAFKAKRGGVDDYFGFNLSGDGRYLLEDFTVTHNSILINKFCYSSIKNLEPTLYVALEMPAKQVAARSDSMWTSLRYDQFKRYDFKPTELRLIRRRYEKFVRRFKNKFHIISMPVRTADINAVRAAIDDLREEFGFVPKTIAMDSGDHLITTDRSLDNFRLQQSGVYWDQKAAAEELGCVWWSTTHAGREWAHQIATAEATSESYDKARIADLVLSINDPNSKPNRRKVMAASDDDDEEEEGEIVSLGGGKPGMKRLELFVAKNRDGVSQAKIDLDCDFSRMLIREAYSKDNPETTGS